MCKNFIVGQGECWGWKTGADSSIAPVIPWYKSILTLCYKFQKSHLILKPLSIKIWKQKDIISSLVAVSTITIDGDSLTVSVGRSQAGLARTLQSVPSHHVQWVPGLSLGVKRPGRDVDQLGLSLEEQMYSSTLPLTSALDGVLTTHPPSSAEVKERVELYICSPSGPSWPVLGWTLPLPLPFNFSSRNPPSQDHFFHL